VDNLNSKFWVYPGSIDINETTGQVDANGSPVAVPDGNYPGRELEGPPDGNGMTIEMGSLYVGAPNAPASSGLLLTFVVDANCTITISGNTARGTVVNENVTVADVNYVGDKVVCACPGDLNDDGWWTLTDVLDTYAIYLANGQAAVPKGHALWDDCADMNFDDWVTLTDVLDVYAIYLGNGSAAKKTHCQTPMEP
jgi:hypothetical protein